MSAVLNTNYASLVAAKNLLGAQNKLAASVERLSSGLRINRARDDAAGLGVANSLTAQINGANQGIRNLNDAISMVQTAEGAIAAATEMGQRLLMLATQGANGTLGVAERRAIQNEMSELLSSIDSIGARTKFSGNPLLSVALGVAETSLYSMQISNTSTDKIDLQNSAFRNIGFTTSAATETLKVSVGALTNGQSITVSDGTVSRKVAFATAVSKTSATAAEIAAALQSGSGGDAAVTGITVTDTASKTAFDTRWVGTLDSANSIVTFASATANSNVDNLALLRVGTTSTSTIAYQEGAIANAGGQASVLKTKADALNTALLASETGGESNEERLAVVSAFQELQAAATDYVAALGTQRSKLGAYQNQMEYTLANITELSANLSSARSRIIDTDYAAETAALTRGQILQQAATAMLAQANQMPNVILTLLK